MKTHSLLVALLCIAGLSATAQTEKGTNFIGGSIGYGKNSNTPKNTFNANVTETSDFSINPKFGHFFSNNFAIGLSTGYVEIKSSYAVLYATNSAISVSTITNKTNSFIVSPFIRYYVNIVDKFKFFGQGTLSAAFGKTEQTNTGNPTFASQQYKYKSSVYGASIVPGFAFFPTPKWAVELTFPLLAYNKTKMKDDGVNQNSQASDNEMLTFGLNTFTPSIGVNYHF